MTDRRRERGPGRRGVARRMVGRSWEWCGRRRQVYDGLEEGRTFEARVDGLVRDSVRVPAAVPGFYLWVGDQVNGLVSVWGVTGYGTAALSLTPDGASTLETGVSMVMPAVGTRGELIGSGTSGRFALAFKADPLLVTGASDLA